MCECYSKIFRHYFCIPFSILLHLKLEHVLLSKLLCLHRSSLVHSTYFVPLGACDSLSSGAFFVGLSVTVTLCRLWRWRCPSRSVRGSHSILKFPVCFSFMVQRACIGSKCCHFCLFSPSWHFKSIFTFAYEHRKK